MADGRLGSIELKFLARGGFDIGSHQVQTKGRVKGGRLSTDSPEWLVLYGGIKQLYKLTNIYTAKKEMSFLCHLILEKDTECVKV